MQSCHLNGGVPACKENLKPSNGLFLSSPSIIRVGEEVLQILEVSSEDTKFAAADQE